MKTKEKKSKIIESLTSKVKEYPTVIFAQYQGLTVSDFENFRRKIYSPAAPFKFEVIKNNLLVQAAKKIGADTPLATSELKGPMAVMWAKDAVSAAKFITEFAKELPSGKLKLSFAVVDGKVITSDDVVTYSKIPPREVLLSHLAGVLRYPIAGLEGILSSPARNLILILHQKSS